MRFHKGGLATVLAALVLTVCSGVLAQDRAAPQSAAATPAPTPESTTLAPGQPIPAATLEAFVDGVAAQAMARDHIAGAAVTVVQNGQVVLKKGYGVDRRSPARAVDPDRTLFRLGAMTRVFTWAALMREIEAGHIRLDAPVNVYLPQKVQVRDQGYKRPVTIRDLLAHTEGFEDRAYGQLIEQSPDRIRTLETYLRQERPGRIRGAGDVPTASSYGAALAGEALVQVTGKTMQALTEAEITGPLGLRRTTLRESYPARADLPAPMDPALAQEVSQGFGWSQAGYEVRPYEYMTQVAPSMAASASAGDMARFMLAVLGDGTLEGATIYSPQVARQFRTPLKTAAPGAGSWDYGIMEFALPGGFKGYGHTGQTLSFRTEMVTVPQLGLGVFVATNSDTGGAFTRELPQRILERFYSPGGALTPAASPWLLQNASAFTGAYVTSRRAYYGLEGFLGRLRAEQKVTLSSDGFLVTPGPDGPRRWTPDALASRDTPYVVFHSLEGPEQLVFEMNQGRAERWFEPSGEAFFQRSGVLASVGFMMFLAAATAIASAAALAGPFLRDRREFRQTTIQGRADAAQLSGAILWLTGLACFAVWSLGAAEPTRLMYGWPGPLLLIASACGFVAAILAVLCLVLLPVVWRGGRRLDSWTSGRKARFTVTSLVFGAFTAMLAIWGFLAPWSP